MSKVYVLGAKRTPIGAFLGSLSSMHPAQYGAQVLKTLVEETKINVNDIYEVQVGNILPAGLGQGIARQVSIHAGIPVTIPAHTVNMVCGSGMKTVMNAYGLIASNQADLMVAGGVESMSKAPYILPDRMRNGHKMGGFKVLDHMIDDALMDPFNDIHMGITAENIVERYGIRREDQDALAAESQRRAAAAQDAGRFVNEIVPITVPSRKGDIVFEADEYINRATNYEKLSTLRPAFKKDGSVTAGNSSGINDGASFMILASEAYVKEHNLTPLAEVVGVGQGGVEPTLMGLGPTPAIKQALSKASLTLKDMELLELNEAFAAQALGVMEELQRDHGVDLESLKKITNIYGGAIALGHPVGASGNRILVTLLHALHTEQKNLGLASLCIGGGMGTAVILRRV